MGFTKTAVARALRRLAASVRTGTERAVRRRRTTVVSSQGGGSTVRTRAAVLAVLATGLLTGTASPASAAPPPVITRHCVDYQLHTAYGALGACTETRAAYNARDARVGYYSPHNNSYSWITGYLPAGGDAHECFSQGEVYSFFGGRHLSTAYGAASWGIQINRVNGTGRFGWFNWNAMTFSADSGPLPFTNLPGPSGC